SSLANRLIRLDKQINDTEKNNFATHAGGNSIPQVVKQLLNAYDPDAIGQAEQKVRQELIGEAPVEITAAIEKEKQQLIEKAIMVFHNPELREYIVDVRRKYDQVMDNINMDEVANIGWVKDRESAAFLTISNLTAWIEA